MVVTATEFKTNIGKYLALVDSEDIFITKNGRSIAKVVSAKNGETPITDSLYGIIKGMDMSDGEIREERLLKKHG